MHEESWRYASGKIKRSEIKNRFFEWWKSFQSQNGARSRLRRVSSIEEALLEAETFYFKHTVLGEYICYEILGLTMTVLSALKDSDSYESIPFIKQLAIPNSKNGKIPVSEMRFKKLMKSHNFNELYLNLRQITSMLENKINPLDLFDFIYAWENEFSENSKNIYRKNFKFKCAEDYYGEYFKYKNNNNSDDNKSDKTKEQK